MGTGRRVGAGSPAKGPALLANFHPPFTVAAATVFAGKPAPTTVVGTHRGLDTGRCSELRSRYAVRAALDLAGPTHLQSYSQLP
ncbi:hypothetical protein C4Q27_05190 [Pseudomonas sp. SWI36]|nr:hypothetical protein C4Q27_05190 [Pseudomonas sp. SWI36]